MTPEQERIAALERRLAEMESQNSSKKESGTSSVKKFFGKVGAWIKSHKKISIAVIAALVVLTIAIPILVTYCGVRGIYVNEKDPTDYYKFGVSSFVSYSSEFGSDEAMEGKYSISGSKIKFSLEDEMFGDMSETLSFKKLDGNDRIKIGDDVYFRAGFSRNKTIKVAFDANGGSGSTTKKIKIGNKISQAPTPVKTGYRFLRWETKAEEIFDEFTPIWKDTVFYAVWADCDHYGMTCTDQTCSRCGKAYNDMDVTEKAALSHSFDENCTCENCDKTYHAYNSEHVCIRCGKVQIEISGTTLMKVQPDYLGAYAVPENITTIGEGAFRDCIGLTSVTIPEGVTIIGSSAFNGCTNLTSINIPDSVTDVGGNAFEECVSLQYNEYDNALYLANQSNPYFCLIKCKDTAITQCTIHEQTRIITGSAFLYQSGLTSIEIPSSVTSIGSSTFYSCSCLTSVTFAEGSQLTSIGNYAFEYCSGLTSVTIPNSVTSIGYGAFYGCSGLTSITIPESVTSIGDYAFSGCYKLVEVFNKSSLSITKGSDDNGCVGGYAKNVYTTAGGSKLSTTDDWYILYTDGDTISLIGYVGTDTELTLPAGITDIYPYAFYNRSSLTSITIPASVTRIGDYAFRGCSGLTSITFEGTTAQWNAISKMSGWNYDTGNYTIHCTDGNIER